VLPDAVLRQALLETLDVDRGSPAWRALEMLVRELKGGPREAVAAALALALLLTGSVAEARPWSWLGVMRHRDTLERRCTARAGISMRAMEGAGHDHGASRRCP